MGKLAQSSFNGSRSKNAIQQLNVSFELSLIYKDVIKKGGNVLKIFYKVIHEFQSAGNLGRSHAQKICSLSSIQNSTISKQTADVL